MTAYGWKPIPTTAAQRAVNLAAFNAGRPQPYSLTLTPAEYAASAADLPGFDERDLMTESELAEFEQAQRIALDEELADDAADRAFDMAREDGAW